MEGTPEEGARARVLIADAAELVRRGIRDVLSRDGRFTVVGELARTADVGQACRELSPDLVFFGLGEESDDLEGESEGLAALRRALQLFPSARIIVLAAAGSMEDLLEPVRAGANGVLLRDAPAATLLEAAEEVLAGGAALDPRLTRNVFEVWRSTGTARRSQAQLPQLELAPSVLRALSPREREVLRSLAEGHRNKEIAAQLGVSVGTVKTHLRHIFRKMMVADRTAAVLTALQVRLREAA